MNYGFVMFSKVVVGMVALAALAVCIVLLPELAREAVVEDPAMTHLRDPLLLAAYTLLIPFFIALYQTYKLLNCIASNQVFTNTSVKILQKIKYCAIVFGLLIIANVVFGISLVRNVHPNEDVTHVVALGGIFVFIAIVVAVAVAVLRRLLEEAITIKAENDFTV